MSTLYAQDIDSCPCENCPGMIEDDLRFTNYQLNVFNVENNSLANPGQCVSRIGLQFIHEYSGDLLVELVSPGGDTVQLIGPVTFSQGDNGQTDNAIFDISFVRNSVPAEPDGNFEPTFNNNQPWNVTGFLEGAYYPFRGSLADFDEGSVNGTWTLRVGDFNQERNDEGTLRDFSIEFCDSEGLICDPCLDPEDIPDCVFKIDPGEATVVPDEIFCLPVYAENVAFLETLQFPLSWDPTVMEFVRVDSFQIENLVEGDFDVTNVGSGNLTLNYLHDTDTLGLVVADSTAIFNVCFQAIGVVGDSTFINVPTEPVAIDVDDMTLMTETFDGKVIVSVDSTADCVNAIQICGSEDISVDKTKGPGFDEMEGCSPSGQEFQSRWYRFDVLESGDFEFMVQPKGAAIFTYSLYQDACPNTGNGTVAACELNFPPVEGSIIGLADNPSTSFGDLGGAPTNFSPTLAVTAGETYFLMIDNASSNGIGFDLSFAGSAIIGDETLRAIIAAPNTLNCTNPSIRLDATQSTQGSQYIPNWTSNDGEIDFSARFYQPLITLGGTFTLTIEDTQSGCVSTDSVFVATDMVFPEAFANGEGTIDCNAPELIINSAGSSLGDDFEYQWTNLDIAIPDLPTTPELNVEVAGNYELAITNSINGCISRDSVLVLANFVDPQLTTADNFISCFDPLATLTATSTTADVTYEWTGGNLTNLETTPEIMVNDTGVFNIRVLAPNGCTTSEDVFVRDDRIFPEVEAGTDFQLNCFTPINTLNGEGSSIGTIFEYNWSTPNGNFVLGEDTTTLSPSVDSGGLYFLAVTNTSNGCISLDSVNIDTSFTNPLIRFAGDTIITCTNPELVIDASSSDSGAIFQFEWFGENGNVLIGDDTYHPSVSQSGNYIFNITNTENGCFSTAIRTITPDVEFPIADAGPSDILNCTNNSLVQLDGGNSSLGIDFLYQWTTLDGNIVGDTTGTDAATDTQGTYHLEVTDSTNGCSAQDSVTIIEDLVEPTITLPRDTLLTCENPSLNLETISLTADVEFLWVFPNGDSSLNGAIEVMTMGSYFITVTGANGCTSFGEVVVTSDQDLPNIDIEDPETLTCQNQSIEISAENSDQGPDLDFLWSTDDGQFAQDSQALQVNPIVTAGGIYYLELRNTLTGCVARDTTEVPSNVDNPEINLVDNLEIFTCTNNSVPLSVTSDVENIQYQWRLDSDLVSEAANFEATAPGVYDILAINPANDCSTSSMVVVQADTIAPFADAGMTQELNCAVDRVNLDGSLSATGNGLSYIWNAPTNQSFSDTTIIQVSQPGLYNLLVINTINGCSTSDSVRVTESRDDPIADAGADIIFCTGTDNVNFTLGGGATSQGNNFSYSWSNSSQTILGTDIQLNVSTADTFLLQVLNTDNQCESADTVLVSERIGPVVSVDSVGAIDCVSNEITFIAQSDIPSSTIKWVGSFETLSNELTVTDALLTEDFMAIAEDTLTGCLGQSIAVQVIADREFPELNAGNDTEVNCADTLRLDGQSLSLGIETAIEWRTEDGNIVGSRNDLNPIVDAAGRYILRIENTENFCVSEDTVFVTTDQLLPTVNIGEDVILTCNNPSLTINPDTISQGTNFFYLWQDDNNNVVARTDTLAVNLPGVFQLTVIDSSNLCRKSDVVEVIDSLNPPFIEIAEPDLITCLNNQVTLNTTANVVDGTFEWNILSDTGNIVGAANNLDLLVNSAGTYQIEVTNDFSGCQGARNITVIDVRQAVEIEAGDDRTLTCFNDTTIVAAGTIFTPAENLRFRWTANLTDFVPIDTSLIFTIDRAGTYFLNVVDTISFCEAIDSFEVDENIEDIEYTIGGNLILDCRADSVILGDLTDFGQQDFIYRWTTQDGTILSGENEPMAIASSAGLYELFIQNRLNGCTTSDSQRVVENIRFPTADVGNGMVITCINDEITIGGENTSMGDNFIYEWTTEAGNILEGISTPFALINAAGNYQLSVLDTTNQCQDNQRIVITDDKLFPVVDLPTGLDIDCIDDFIPISPNIQLPENRVVVEWSTNTGLLLSDATTFTAQAGMPGIYFLALTDTSNSCVTLDTVEILDNRDLPEVVMLQNQILDCDNASITIDAEGSASGEDITYEWQDETGRVLSNNTSLTISLPGNYILFVTDDSNNCVDTDTVLISENTNPPTSAFFDIQAPSCNDFEDGTIEVLEVVGGSSPFRYALDENIPDLVPTFSDLAPDTYVLSITDEFECTWDTTITLSQPALIQTEIQVSDTNLETGELATFNVITSIPEEDIVTIEWFPSNLFDCFNCSEVSASFLNNTTVEVIITDINGCEGFASIDLEVALAATPNAITPNGDGSNDFFIVPQIEREPDGFPDSELIIFNRWGDVLFQISPYDNNWGGQNSKGENLVEGTYYYVLRLDTREGEVIKGDITIIRR